MDGYEGYVTEEAISGMEAQAVNGAAIVIERETERIAI